MELLKKPITRKTVIRLDIPKLCIDYVLSDFSTLQRASDPILASWNRDDLLNVVLACGDFQKGNVDGQRRIEKLRGR